MKELIEDYERRLKTVMEEISKGGNDLTINRLGTKASCYRTFLTELNRALTLTSVLKPLKDKEATGIEKYKQDYFIRSGNKYIDKETKDHYSLGEVIFEYNQIKADL
jgi:hypothetical protein